MKKALPTILRVIEIISAVAKVLKRKTTKKKAKEDEAQAVEA